METEKRFSTALAYIDEGLFYVDVMILKRSVKMIQS